VLWDNDKGGSSRLLDAPASVWETLMSKLQDEDRVKDVLGQLADHPEDAERILSECGLDAAIFRTSMTISQEPHVRMQAAWQKHVTNSVSKTINLPNSATVDDIKDAFWLAWETDCKAVTVYRDGSKSMQVLETGSTESETLETRATETGGDHLLVPRRRPGSVRGITDRIRSGHGSMYVTVNFDDDGNPFEVFSTLGKSGGCDSAHLEGISRLVSLALRSGIDPDQVVEQLRGITCCPVWDGGTLVRSTEDAVSLALSRHVHDVEPLQGRAESSGGTAQLGMFPSTQEAITEDGNIVAQTNGNQVASGARCPECSGSLVHQEGCLHCYDCGYNKCE